MQKIFVDVIAKFNTQGKLVPLSIVWQDGRRFDVQKVISEKQCPAMKSGGFGTRYCIIINNQTRYLYYNENTWFIEH